MSFGSFGAPLEEVWRAPAKKQGRRKERFESRCDDDDQMDAVMNMRSNSCGGREEIKSRSKPRRKCPPAPPSSPRRPPSCPHPKDDPPPQWVPINTPPKIPTPMVDAPFFDGAGASWGDSYGESYGDSVVPFGLWEGSEGFQGIEGIEGIEGESSKKQLDSPAFLSAMPQFLPDDRIGGPPHIPALKAESSDFENDDDFTIDEEEEDPRADTLRTHAEPRVEPRASNVKETIDGATFAADMAVYIASGVILIFVMEQFIQMGMRIQ